MDGKKGRKPGFWAVVQSTLAAAFGVQSTKNREQDFQHGNLWVYVAAGVIFTAFFVLAVLGLVRLVLAF
ncbi:MAG: DUF2970 domain-containing protein [Cellvibrionales bacterium]|nr:DUF2970 domain-containing protein [Cellvibrionales bacterium]